METNSIFRILIFVAELGVAAAFYAFLWRSYVAASEHKGELLGAASKYYAKHTEMTPKKLDMSRRGIMYRMGDYNFSPFNYLLMRLAVGAVAALVGYLVFARAALLIPLFVVGFFATDWYFTHENRVDNEEMMMDIYNTYANIKIQMSSGVYIRECMEYTYSMARNERFRQAVGELVLNFSDRTMSSFEAVQIFKNRFDNSEIDKLASMMSSFLQYGMNTHHADDIMTEIQSLLQADTLKAEHDIESKAGLVNFAFFASIIAMVVYMVFMSFQGSGGLF